jgi:predicted O-methyltransferase YrrM
MRSVETISAASVPLMPAAGRTSRRIGNIVRLGVRHPTWLHATVRGRLRARSDRERGFVLSDYREYLRTAEAGIVEAFGIRGAEYEALAKRVRVPPRTIESTWSAGDDLIAVTGAIVLLTAPQTVVETGVAMGFTTAVILAALDDNQHGHLHSIDMPPLQVDARPFVGQAVPHELRDRWSLHVGPSQALLPGLLREVAPIDLFVHDADHTYAGQYEEFTQVWPHLCAGGTLVSDDVANPAFLDFAAGVGARPYLVARQGQRAAVGLLRKA